ncbi:MAG: hypothetical protein J2P17_14685 [Mycobacterium sp.]|nr:hypothetical protein [Mycobacterium sp.]
MVNLVTVPGVEVMRTGKWNLSTGEWECTPKEIAAALDAHEKGILRKPVIRLGHNDPRFTGDPAVGWLDNLRASADGQALVGDMVGVPEWLADILPSAYPSRSIEGLYDYTAPDGTEHEFVLTGLALLGATRPGVENLQSLQDVARLFDIAAAGQVGGKVIEITIEAAEKPLTPGKSHADPGYLDRQGNQAKDGNGVPRYALDNAEQVRAALGYFEKNRDKEHYTAAQRKEVFDRINAAAKKFGVKVSAGDGGKTEAAAASDNEGGAVTAIPDYLAEALGVDASADEETVKAKLAELVKPADEPKPEAVAAAAGNIVTVEASALDQLKADAAAGRAARDQQIADDDESTVMAAIGQGKIPPARKEHWLKALKADREGNKQVLASLAAGLIPVKETGHTGVAGRVGSESGFGDEVDTERQIKEYASDRVMAALGFPTKKASVN